MCWRHLFALQNLFSQKLTKNASSGYFERANDCYIHCESGIGLLKVLHKLAYWPIV